MKILVIGASQGTGALAVKAALGRGHTVTAFSRNPGKLALDHPSLIRQAGDFHQKPSVEAAVRGQEAVIITASATSMDAFKKNPHYFSQGTGYVVEAMKTAGVKRLVVLSAFGVGETRKLNFLLDKIFIPLLLRTPFEDHERQERMVRESGLEWVIARPTRLTNGPARGRYVKEPAAKKVPSTISRADVADFLVQACESRTFVGQAVQLGG